MAGPGTTSAKSTVFAAKPAKVMVLSSKSVPPPLAVQSRTIAAFAVPAAPAIRPSTATARPIRLVTVFIVGTPRQSGSAGIVGSLVAHAERRGEASPGLDDA